MKNPKTLYILISLFCFFAIIAGICSEFLIKKADENNVNNPNVNDIQENIEKAQEEVKQQFSELFNNTINAEQYDFSNINKIDQQKEIVYSAYTIQKQENNYEVNINLPAINIYGKVPVSFNKITQEIFANKASEVLNSNNSYKTIYNVDYVSCINGNILSVAIKSTLKEGNNPQRVIVQTYNYNLVTGEKVDFNSCITGLQLNTKDIQTKIDRNISKAAEEANILAQSGYNVYKRDLNSEMYKINNISTFLLDENANLYVIFAYGNQNFTSEMDVVLFE